MARTHKRWAGGQWSLLGLAALVACVDATDPLACQEEAAEVCRQVDAVSFRARCVQGQVRAFEACLAPATCVAQPAGETTCQFSPADAVDGAGGDANSDAVTVPLSCPAGQARVGDKCRVICQLYSCPTASWCTVGLPVDCKPIQCTKPAIVAPRPVWKVTRVVLLEPGKGCDFNDDGKPRNVLDKVVTHEKEAQKNADLQVASGELVRLFEAVAPTTDGTPFTMAWLHGTRDPADLACDQTSTTANCKVSLRKQTFALGQPGTCQPLATCKASWLGQTLTLTCTEPMPLPVLLKPELDLAAYGVTMKGTLHPVSGVGVLEVCGWFRMEDIETMLTHVPDEFTKAVGGKASARSLLQGIIKPDLDADGDGTEESLSFAANLELAPATLTGYAP